MSLTKKLTSTLLALGLTITPLSSYSLAPPSHSTSKSFQKYEPILEKLTHEKPVPSNNVHFLSKKELAKRCGHHNLGCYNRSKKRISLLRDMPPRFPSQLEAIEKEKPFQLPLQCKKYSPNYDISILILDSYLHEQGHHYDHIYDEYWSKGFGGWEGELMAETFRLFVEEYLVKNNLIDANVLVYNLRLFSSSYLSENLEVTTSADISTLHDSQVLLALLALPHITSFEDLHSYIKIMPLKYIRAKVFENANHLDAGYKKLEQIVSQYCK